MSFVNLKDVKEDSGGSLIPAGKYLLRCNKAEVKPTKAGDGRYIKCEFRVHEGEFENRVVFHIFNIENPSSMAQQIGLGQLKSFLINANYHDPDNLASLNDLLGLKSLASVKITTNEEYGNKNEISSFNKKEDNPVQKNLGF